MALLSEDRENTIRVSLASMVMVAGALLSFLRTEDAYSFLPSMLQNAVWAILVGVVQLGVAAAIWVTRFRKLAAIAFVLLCALHALFLYYHLVIAADLVLKGPWIILLVLFHLLCIKAGVKIAMHSHEARSEGHRA
jgi:hypothetical protein